MIQLARDQFQLDAGAGEQSALAAEFAARHLVCLSGFLAPALLRLIEDRLPSALFSSRKDAHGMEIEQTLEEPSLVALFAIALNDPRLFAFVEGVTGCGAVGCFMGRVYRRGKPQGAGDQHYPWHDDVSRGRLVGLSINLTREPYEGGVLQIRDADTGRALAEKANTGYGDAMLFRISPALEHQVTPVAGDTPRLVLAGWFCSEPHYAEVLGLEGLRS
jgi:2OG-Fe(II) oxygenase superfamily